MVIITIFFSNPAFPARKVVYMVCHPTFYPYNSPVRWARLRVTGPRSPPKGRSESRSPWFQSDTSNAATNRLTVVVKRDLERI